MSGHDIAEYSQAVGETGHIRAGSPLPFGAHFRGDGVNFALFSRNATQVWLEFYDKAEDEKPGEVVELKAAHHRTGDVWHVWVQGVEAGQLYAYRVDGPYAPEKGQRFNKNRLLLDHCILKSSCVLVENARGLKTEVINDGGACLA